MSYKIIGLSGGAVHIVHLYPLIQHILPAQDNALSRKYGKNPDRCIRPDRFCLLHFRRVNLNDRLPPLFTLLVRSFCII